MKALVIYDSEFGNTEQIAQAISRALGAYGEVAAAKEREVRLDHLAGLDLLVVGSPTQRFRQLPAISAMLDGFPQNSLKGVKAAAFDTRLTMGEINKTAVLAFFVKLAGDSAYAAKHIANQLKKKGGQLIAPPEGFYVDGMKGPLVQGELERAAEWAKQTGAKI